jgi:hypothetical protein
MVDELITPSLSGLNTAPTSLRVAVTSAAENAGWSKQSAPRALTVMQADVSYDKFGASATHAKAANGCDRQTTDKSLRDSNLQRYAMARAR